MAYDPHDPFDEKFRSGTFAPHLIFAMSQMLAPDDIFVDVGAQKGFVTLYAATLVGGGGRVISFEPDHRSASLLAANCEANHFRQVTIHQLALGKTREKRLLKLSTQLGWSSFYPNERNAHTMLDASMVEVCRLDDVLLEELGPDDCRRVKLVKIDSEGSEPEVLGGMERLFGLATPALWIEINTGSLRAAGSSEASILDFLADHDYSVFTGSIVPNSLGLPCLRCLPYRGNPTDTTHKVFDVLALHATQDHPPSGFLLGT
jgi:FkbM family methyltransferase